MSDIASLIARFRHWQAFLYTCAPFFGAGVLSTPSFDGPPTAVEMEAVIDRMMLTLFPVAIVLYSWIWSIGHTADRASVPDTRRPDRFFNLAFPYTFAYLVYAYFFFPRPGDIADPIVPIGITLILHIFAVICSFYAIASAAMRLKTSELGSRANFGESFGTFFLIWFFPLGVWFVQSRLNAADEKIPSEG